MKFCVVGTGRSGTTFLCRLLNLHPDIFVFNETHWIPKMYEWIGLNSTDPEILSHIVLNTFHVTGKRTTQLHPDELSNIYKGENSITINQYVNRLGGYHAMKEGKLYWADKTPDYGPWMSIIQRIWPECKFLHLIRHGADVALSMQRHPGFQWMASAREDSWVPASYNQYYRIIDPKEADLVDYQNLWFRRLSRIEDESTLLKAGSYSKFKLEQFLSDPRGLLEDMCDFVELRAPQNWIEECIIKIKPHRINHRQSSRHLIQFTKEQIELLHHIGYK